jgi:zinc transport system substrate-binding protein
MTPQTGNTPRPLWRWLLGPALAILLACALMTAGCAKAIDPWEGVPGTPRIVVTIPPLYSFTRAVAGDEAAIQCLCTTTGPHHYEKSFRDARLLDEADVFFAIGLELDENFSNPLISDMKRPSRLPELRYVKLGNRLPAKLVHKMRQHDHDEDKEDDHKHGELDPHVWLGTEQVIAMIGMIRDELVKVDPDHAGRYTKNADAYIKKLRKIHDDWYEKFKGKKVKRIISFHDALQYFADSFGLEIAEVIETGPGDEPTPGHLNKLVDLCRNPKKPIGAITVEPQYPESSSAAQVRDALQNRIELVKIDPLETADPDELTKEGAAWYEKRMLENLKALDDVLK